jgi:hypothetical protein
MDRATAPSPAAPRRRGEAARAPVCRRMAAVLVWTAGAASACSLSQQGVSPPADTFFYPASAVVDSTKSWLFVTNSNADLRYNDGTLVMVDLVDALADRTNKGGPFLPAGGPVLSAGGGFQTWDLCPQEDYVNPLPRSDPQICCWDRLDSSILNCDERRYVQPDATVRIGSFAAGMLLQPDCAACDSTPATASTPGSTCVPDPTTPGRLLIGVRGDTSLTWIDLVAPAGALHPSFKCTDAVGPSLTECDSIHRIIDTTSALVTESMDTQAPIVQVPDEPYALELDSTLGLLYIGHLVGSTAIVDSGGVSLFDVSSTRAPLTMDSFLAPFPSPFPPNSAGAFGITALELHVPLGQPVMAGARQELFASSRYVPAITAMAPFGNVTPPFACDGSARDLVVESAGDSFNSGLVGSEMRGIEFIEPKAPTDPSAPPYAQRAYALERVPPDLVGFNIARNNAGQIVTTPTDVSETCSSPTFLYQHDAGDGPRLYVNCFDTGEIYVFDPTVPTLLTTLQVGRGPAGLVFPEDSSPIAYVIGFSDNNLSVLDLAPGSATQYHVIERIGFPSVTPR